MRKIILMTSYVLGSAIIVLWSLSVIFELVYALSTKITIGLVRWRLDVYNKSFPNEFGKKQPRGQQPQGTDHRPGNGRAAVNQSS